MIKTFQRTEYGREHKLVILASSKPKIKNAEVLSFDEEFQHYLSMCKKSHWKTIPGFLLEYNSSLKDLQRAYYVYADDETNKLIKKKFKILEEC